ncbi:MAG: hypothetical protein MUD10_01560 [Candidatus Pacebacteria bacterium]|jgi:hypothetical protein|nr:hypothetical protein [Candidatus Paceibacterota bacterium]
MPLPKFTRAKKIAPLLVFAAVLAATSVSQGVFAAGPKLMNVNPQGTVTNSQVTITFDTEDLARCRYSTSDTGYESMNNNMETPDGLYHSADLGTLAKKSYTYYVRCLDYDNNANDESKEVSFKVGDIGCVGDDCNTTDPTPSGSGPVLSGFSPSGTIYDPNVTLTVTTDKAANCRCGRVDRNYDDLTWAFTSNDRFNHIRNTVMPAGGYYTYYIKCKDDDGNINAVTGTINFRYSAPYVAPPPPPSDTTAPSVSSLAPSGDIEASPTTLSCSTNEAATCKYGLSDGDYDSFTDTMAAGSDKTSHSADVTLPSPGSYTYYVRCADTAGNKGTVSSTISFAYVPPVKDGPVISNANPSGEVYQKDVALTVTTDKAADCRYSTSDDDFDAMSGNFETSDGTLHLATLSLETYGPYTYYVRCADKDGNKDTQSEAINFEYVNPNPDELVTDPAEATTTEPVACTEYKMGEKDGGCDYTQDCLCDPDCPVSASEKNHDKDCDNVTTKTAANNSWLVILIIGLLLLIIIVIIVIIIRRRSTEEDVELP